MDYDKELKKYLAGDTFSNGKVFEWKWNDSNLLYRDEYLIEKFKNKKLYIWIAQIILN